LFEGRRSIQDQSFALVVEGYMDVVALAEHGISNAVATLGTAPNEHHCETLYRTAPGIVFCFDGDRAGRAAAWRALEAALPCLRDGRDAHFLFLPDGDDPDSLVQRMGVEGFMKTLTMKVSIIDYLFENQSEGLELEEVGGKAMLAERVKPLLARMPDGIYRDLSLQRLEQTVGMPLRDLAAQVKQNKPAEQKRAGASSQNRREPTEQTGGNRNLSLMRRTMLLLLNYPAVAESLDEQQLNIDTSLQGAPLLLSLISECRQQPGLSTGGLIEKFRDDENWQILQKLAAMDYMPDGSTLDTEGATREFNSCINQLQKRATKRAVSELEPGQRKGLLGVGRRRKTR